VPASTSSITSAAPAAPRRRCSRNSAIAASACATLPATTTPLPAASPSAFTTIGAPRRRTNSRAAAASVNRSHSAVGMPAASHTSLQKLLLPSRRAAAAEGPQQAIPASPSASASPSTSGASGPGTTRSMAWARAKRTSPALSMAATGTFVATSAVPGLPGAHHTAVAPSRASATHSACSRPPLPTTSTRMRPPSACPGAGR
jgi:exodeoxyribonuclease VII large subunit